MNSREKILRAIAMNKPAHEELSLPDLSCTLHYEDVCRQFIGMMERIGGEVVYVGSRECLAEDLERERASGRLMINRLQGGGEERSMTAEELKGLETCYLPGRLGVAENGAIWVEEEDMGNRLLPFICNRLILVLSPDKIVSNMHQAYREIAMQDTGFGVFIAGPSRTADIEQNLVIGAHGPARMTVYLV